MTIAACYLSPEGVVLGSDSTSTYQNFGQSRHYNHGQKLFELGENSTVGIVTWGVGGLRFGSYRTLMARLADGVPPKRAGSVLEVSEKWIDLFWTEYQNCFAGEIAHLKSLSAKPAMSIINGKYDPSAGTRPKKWRFAP